MGRGPARRPSDLLGPSPLRLEGSLFRFCLLFSELTEEFFSTQEKAADLRKPHLPSAAGTVPGSTSTGQLHGRALLGTQDAKGLLCEDRGGGTSISITSLGPLVARGKEQISLAPYPGAMAQLTPLTPVTPVMPGPQVSH